MCTLPHEASPWNRAAQTKRQTRPASKAISAQASFFISALVRIQRTFIYSYMNENAAYQKQTQVYRENPFTGILWIYIHIWPTVSPMIQSLVNLYTSTFNLEVIQLKYELSLSSKQQVTQLKEHEMVKLKRLGAC